MEKNPASRAPHAPSVHKLPQSVCLETWIIKISYLAWQEKLIHEKNPASRAPHAINAHKLPQNVCLKTWTIKKSYLAWQKY